MKKSLLILTILISSSIISSGQTKNVPRNLKQAVSYLSVHCPDSLKIIIKNTDDDNLKALCYPWGGEFKPISEWTSDVNSNSKIVRYLRKKGVSQHSETVILKAFKQYLLGQKISQRSILRPFQEIENKWKSEDKIRFTSDSLRGVYIPKDLEDCFAQIDTFWPDSIKTQIKKMPEDEFTGRLHLGFGMWMRNNWQLWGGSRLSKYFNGMDIYHPDNMSGIILTSYHRYLNHQEIRLNEQIQHHKEYLEKSEKESIEHTKEEFSEYHIGDTVLYTYPYDYSSIDQENKFLNDICIAKGKILEKDEVRFLLKIRLIESCYRKGIIYYDNKDSLIYNRKTDRFENPKKRIIRHMRKDTEKWFIYSNWDTQY